MAQALSQMFEEAIQVSQMNPSDLMREFSLYLFSQNKITLERASRLSGMNRQQFQFLLASRDIPIHYTEENLEDDLLNSALIRQS